MFLRYGDLETLEGDYYLNLITHTVLSYSSPDGVAVH